MATHLGIDLRESGLRAALAVDGAALAVSFGPDGAELPLAAHVGSDGEILVGGAAFEEGESDAAGLLHGFFNRLADPQKYQVNGHAVSAPLLLAHLLTEVVAQVLASGATPRQIVLAHPDGVSPAVLAGIRSAVELSELEIHKIVPAHEAHQLAATVAAGAALLPSVPLIADSNSTRLLTREDLEGPLTPSRPPTPTAEARYETVGPSTVFGETASMPAVSPGPPPIPPQPSATPLPESPLDTNRAVLAGVLGAVAAVLVVGGVVFALTRDGGDDITTTTSTVPASTSLPATSSSVPETTTSVVETTTTLESTTTTSTTSTVAPRLAGDVALSAVGLVLKPGKNGETTVRLGSDANAAMSNIAAVLGAADTDSGWEREQLCDADETRFLRYGDIEIVLFAELTVTTAPAATAQPAGPGTTVAAPPQQTTRTETFGQWYLDESTGDPKDLYLFGDFLGIGDTLGAFNDEYGADLTVVRSGDVGLLSIKGPGGQTVDGVASGTTVKDTVTQLWGGTGCDRGF